MKKYRLPHLINRRYGYWQFDCVIDGKIVMTRAQFTRALRRLMRASKWVSNGRYYASSRKVMLKHDTSPTRRLLEGKTSVYNVRVDATAEIARMFRLKNYQQRNYVIQVI